MTATQIENLLIDAKNARELYDECLTLSRRLRNELEEANDKIAEQQAEIERLRNQNRRLLDNMGA